MHVHSPPSGNRGLILGDILGLNAGLTRAVAALVRFRELRAVLIAMLGEYVGPRNGLEVADTAGVNIFRPPEVTITCLGVAWPSNICVDASASGRWRSSRLDRKDGSTAGLICTASGEIGDNEVRLPFPCICCSLINDIGVAGGAPLTGGRDCKGACWFRTTGCVSSPDMGLGGGAMTAVDKGLGEMDFEDEE